MEKKRGRSSRADVAKEAGVSETIVSYVINANRYVAAEKRRAVEKAVAKLHYSPNTFARALKGKKTNHILFIADDIGSEHFGEIISAMDRTAYGKGYFISLCSDHNDDFFVRRIYERFFDGIVVASASFAEKNIQKLIQTGIPLVLFAIRHYEHLKGRYACIHTGLYEGARSCVRALYERGRKKLLFVDRFGNYNTSQYALQSDERYRGFADQCAEYALPLTDASVISPCAGEDELIACIQKRFSLSSADVAVPDGVFCITDIIACAVMEGIKRAGRTIPHDVSVIGFDNSRLCSYTFPQLSSVKIERAQAGAYAVELLDKLMKNDFPEDTVFPLHAELLTRFIARESL